MKEFSLSFSIAPIKMNWIIQASYKEVHFSLRAISSHWSNKICPYWLYCSSGSSTCSSAYCSKTLCPKANSSYMPLVIRLVQTKGITLSISSLNLSIIFPTSFCLLSALLCRGYLSQQLYNCNKSWVTSMIYCSQASLASIWMAELMYESFEKSDSKDWMQ